MSSLSIYLLVACLITLGLRAFPFVLFHGERTLPNWILRIKDDLPQMIMAVLVVYCLKEIVGQSFVHSIPLIISSIFVIVIHVYKKNTFLSICLGTIVYMVLLRLM